MAEGGEPVEEQKSALRLRLAAARAAMSVEERRRASARIAARVLEAPELAAARRCFVCRSFGDEVDTLSLIAALTSSGRQIFLPRVEKGSPTMHVHPYPCRLERLSFGLEQPARGEPELAADEIDRTLDVALVAGLAFDRCGFRLGYGAGYFDRFLAGRPFPALGLAFAAQIVGQLPVAEHDIALRAVLTERERIEGPAQ